MTPQRIAHTLEPVFDAESRVLLLGTMPSPKSRETGFYYGHPQNRFWRVLGALYGENCEAMEISARRAFLLKHRIALWDVLASCEITGASDASIRHPVANDIPALMKHTKISRIYTTGTKAKALYDRLLLPQTGLAAGTLPSTSPANCRISMESLIAAYRVIVSEGEDGR